MNYDNKKTLYEEAKKSLKKFKGDTESSSTSSETIKLEPTFLVDNDEALLTAGYIKRKQRGKQGGGDREENWRRWRSSRGRTGAREFPRTEYKELEEDTSILNQDLELANQATEIGRILIL